MFKTATVALFVASSSAYSLQNLLNVEVTPEAFKQLNPLITKINADYFALQKKPENAMFKKEAEALKAKYGKAIVAMAHGNKDVMAIHDGVKKNVAMAKYFTPYGAMGAHIDNDKIPEVKKLAMTLFGHGKKIAENKAFLNELKSYAEKPESLAFISKMKKFQTEDKAAKELGELYKQLFKAGEKLHKSKNLFKLSDLPAGFLEQSLF